VEFQGGDTEYVLSPAKTPRARIVRKLLSDADGYVKRIDAYKVGVASVALGVGRTRKGEAVLPGVGITLLKTQGDSVKKGEETALIHGESQGKVEEAMDLCATAFELSRTPRPPGSRILEEIHQG
jgi:thymidine phosphorylase